MNQMAEITPETSFLLSQEQENGKWSRLTSTNKIYVFLNPGIKTRFGLSATDILQKDSALIYGRLLVNTVF